jgi:hypothetical protein
MKNKIIHEMFRYFFLLTRIDLHKSEFNFVLLLSFKYEIFINLEAHIYIYRHKHTSQRKIFLLVKSILERAKKKTLVRILEFC